MPPTPPNGMPCPLPECQAHFTALAVEAATQKALTDGVSANCIRLESAVNKVADKLEAVATGMNFRNQVRDFMLVLAIVIVILQLFQGHLPSPGSLPH